MGQGWIFFNVSKLQYAFPEGPYKSGTMFYRKQPFLVRSLTSPYSVPELAKYLANPPSPGPIAKKGLLSLPDELLDMIMMDTDLPIFDRVYLAITCKKLLATAQRCHLFEYCRDNHAAAWAGCRIVCLGDDARLKEVPEALFPPDLKARIRAQIEAYGEGSENTSAGIDSMCYDDATERGGLYHGLHPYEHRPYATQLPMADRRVFVAAWATTYPARDDWALFNCTKCEYVRAGALAALCGKPDDPQPFLRSCAIDLGTALFTRFCYSSDSSTALSHKPVGIDYGKWVGDRFIISTLERVKKLDEWKDVTDEVIADIKTIYESQYEEAWEKQPERHYDHPQGNWFYLWDDAKAMEHLLPNPNPRPSPQAKPKLLKPATRRPPRKTQITQSTSSSIVPRRRCVSL
ncbi:uncharacterized protein TRAVEDRAFT_48655 [Trametes versicolor FP-101664 SS1]|uniref:uncharacterized protein n=1 Tax=Trametes versicolor (strain FP-101664) TaxID=717944 RepID=UPI0004623FF4|nr:uncharacterized protein TRAVEDRAFT_48655 [Trametes versicolor FP-101664 SS1]EIW57623.1 hypothetical protein TRAVEDRAFT_48655 [Trametes versicolor FP-101664 SS1]